MGMGCLGKVNRMAPTIPATGEKQAKYYSGFTGQNFDPYFLPLKLVGPLSKKEALSRDAAYIIGYYDEKGQLYQIEKFYRGKMHWGHDYLYHENGSLKEAIVIHPDTEEEYSSYFDRNGEALNGGERIYRKHQKKK